MNDGGRRRPRPAVSDSRRAGRESDRWLHLGVDGGNTKTVALISDESGTILGHGRSGCSDAYAVGSVERALEAIEAAVDAALTRAGASTSDLATAGFSLAGVDWPEDDLALRAALARSFGGVELQLVNDSIGALYAAVADGVGVSVVCGTWANVGARGASGSTWHSGWWTAPSGAMGIAGDALRAVYRAALGLEPPTSLVARALELFQEPDVESLLHSFTRRDGRRAPADAALFTRPTLDEAERGDAAARALVEAHGRLLGDYALLAARRVDLLATELPLVLAGGVFGHASRLLPDAIADRMRREAPAVRPLLADLPPVVGALLLGLPVHERGRGRFVRRLRETLPDGSFFAAEQASDGGVAAPRIPGVV